MVVLYAACTVNFLNHRHHDNRECHHYHACKDLDPVPRSDLSITIQKSPRLALWFRFSCRLTLYCTTTFSSLDFSILLTFCTHLFLQFFFQKWLCFEFFQNIELSFVVEQHVFCGQSQTLIFAAVILYLSFSFSVQVSLPYVRVGIAKMIYISSLICFGNFQCCRTWLMIPVNCKVY